MTQTEVNIVGGIVMIAVFYYVMIYKPKRLLQKPTDIQPLLKPSNSLKLGEVCYRHFSDQFYICTQQPFSSLIHSSGLSKNAVFNQELHRLMAEVVLIDKQTRLPITAIILSGKDDDRKGALMSGAGVGCLIFTHVDDEAEVVKSIKHYLNDPEVPNSSHTAATDPSQS